MSSAAQPYPDRRTGVDLVDAKEELRRAIRAARERRTPRARARDAEGFAEVIAELPQVKAASCLSAYVARPTEPGTGPLLERLGARGTRVLLPVLGSGLARDWAWMTRPDGFQVRAPGRPPEPEGPTLGADALALAECIIVPALAVDTAGGRLGQGGGWYDRVLEHARPGVLVVAMVHPEEVYDAQERPLPLEPHDRRVDIVATPTTWRWLRRPDGA